MILAEITQNVSITEIPTPGGRVYQHVMMLGIDFKRIDYDKISDIGVTVNFVERAFKVGTIRFLTAEQKPTIERPPCIMIDGQQFKIPMRYLNG